MAAERAVPVRPARCTDASRLAEILIFTKRSAYRDVFRNDTVSFGEMQVLDLALRFQDEPGALAGWWVYDDGIVKGALLCAPEGDVALEICQLYVDPFFQGGGVGRALLEHAVALARKTGKRECLLWVLEENCRARAFYEQFGFTCAENRRLVEGTTAAELRYVLSL